MLCNLSNVFHDTDTWLTYIGVTGTRRAFALRIGELQRGDTLPILPLNPEMISILAFQMLQLPTRGSDSLTH